MKITYVVCQIPDCSTKCQVGHHIFPKGAYPAARFMLVNGFGTCNGHHKFFCHKDPERFRDLVVDWLRPIDYDHLKYVAGTEHLGFNLADYQVLEKYLKEIRDRRKNGEVLNQAMIAKMVKEPKIRKALVLEPPEDFYGLTLDERNAIQRTAINYAKKGGDVDAEEVR